MCRCKTGGRGGKTSSAILMAMIPTVAAIEAVIAARPLKCHIHTSHSRLDYLAVVTTFNVCCLNTFCLILPVDVCATWTTLGVSEEATVGPCLHWLVPAYARQILGGAKARRHGSENCSAGSAGVLCPCNLNAGWRKDGKRGGIILREGLSGGSEVGGETGLVASIMLTDPLPMHSGQNREPTGELGVGASGNPVCTWPEAPSVAPARASSTQPHPILFPCRCRGARLWRRPHTMGSSKQPMLVKGDYSEKVGVCVPAADSAPLLKLHGQW